MKNRIQELFIKIKAFFIKLKQQLKNKFQKRNEDHTADLDFTDPSSNIKDKVNQFLQKSNKHISSLKSKGASISKNNDFINDKVLVLLKKIEKKIKQVNWLKIPDDLLKDQTRNKIHKAFQIAVVLVSTVLLGKTLGSFMRGSPENVLGSAPLIELNQKQQLSKADLNQLKEASLFKTDKVKVDSGDTKATTTNENLVCESAQSITNLPIKLINTIVLQDSVKSIASVQVRNSQLKELRLGENIDSMAKIDKIERLRIIIKNSKSGECEAVENSAALKQGSSRNAISIMSPSKSKNFKEQLKKINGIINDGNNFIIEKSFLDSKMSNISDILTQARGIQLTNPDGSMSFKITDIEPGGIFAYLGIQDNDIITQIGGAPITDLNQVMNLFGNIASLSKLNLTIKRNGSEVQQNYSIK